MQKKFQRLNPTSGKQAHVIEPQGWRNLKNWLTVLQGTSMHVYKQTKNGNCVLVTWTYLIVDQRNVRSWQAGQKILTKKNLPCVLHSSPTLHVSFLLDSFMSHPPAEHSDHSPWVPWAQKRLMMINSVTVMGQASRCCRNFPSTYTMSRHSQVLVLMPLPGCTGDVKAKQLQLPA